MKKYVLCFVTICIILSFIVVPVRADVLFDNFSIGASAPTASAISGGYVSWEDFNLLSGSIVNSISYRGWTFSGEVVTQVDWAIYTDAGGAPGTMLFSGTGYPTGTAVGYLGQDAYDVKDYVFSVGNLNLSAGVYWLALSNVSPSSYWEVNDSASGLYTPQNSRQNLGSQSPVPRPYDLVFRVIGSSLPFPESVSWNMINDDFNSLSGWGNHCLGGGYAEISPPGQLHLDSTIVGDPNAGAVDQWIAGGIPDNFVIGVKTFLNSIGLETGNAYTISMANRNITLFIQLREDGLFIDRNHSYTEIGNNIVLKQQWQEWVFDVRASDYNTAQLDVYLNGNLVQSNIPCGQQGAANGFVYLGQASYSIHTESHTDYFRLGEHIVPVSIDIKPDSINTRKMSQVSVAILSTTDFNAPDQIDPDSLTFGLNGNEESLAYCISRPKDANKDGIKDLICYFDLGPTGLQCGNNEGILNGFTNGGTPITGSDSVTLIRCK